MCDMVYDYLQWAVIQIAFQEIESSLKQFQMIQIRLTKLEKTMQKWLPHWVGKSQTCVFPPVVSWRMERVKAPAVAKLPKNDPMKFIIP